jgi:hypothetical protein
MFRAFAPAARSSIGAVPAFLLCLFGLRSTRFGGVRAPKEQSRVLVFAGPASADTSGGTRLSIEVGGAATPLSAIRFPRVRLCHDLMTLAQRHGQEVARDLWHYRGSAPGC